MHNAVAVVPSIGASPYLPDLVTSLMDAKVRTVVVVNRSRADLPESNADCLSAASERGGTGMLRFLWRPGQSIYRTWNDGMNLAAGVHQALSMWEPQAKPICHVLNDDLVLSTSSILEMQLVIQYGDPWAILGYDYTPDDTGSAPWVKEVSGTFRKGGVGGFAFAVRPDLCARVHEGFKWWGGDDDLVNATIAKGGKVGVLVGAKVLHPEPSLSASKHPRFDDWFDHDRALLLARWGESY